MIKKFFDKTFQKFILVGILNTLIGTGVMFMLYNLLHFSYWFSSAANYVVGSIVSYFLNKHFTFKVSKKSPLFIFKFIINIALCYFAAYGLARPIAAYLLSSMSAAVQDNVSMLFGMCFFVGLNYIGQRFFVFSSKEREDGQN